MIVFIQKRWLVFGVVLLLHLGVFVFLTTTSVPFSHRENISLQVEFIPTVFNQHIPTAIPDFPHAPKRPNIRQKANQTANPASPMIPSVPSNESPVPAASVSSESLLSSASALLREDVFSEIPTRRDPTRRHAASVPGRLEPYTPNAIVLRPSLSPEDIVKRIGAVFGGNYTPCPDTQQKIRSLLALNQSVGEDELRILLDRERRLCTPS